MDQGAHSEADQGSCLPIPDGLGLMVRPPSTNPFQADFEVDQGENSEADQEACLPIIDGLGLMVCPALSYTPLTMHH